MAHSCVHWLVDLRKNLEVPISLLNVGKPPRIRSILFDFLKAAPNY
jgi:hypothetical protein